MSARRLRAQVRQTALTRIPLWLSGGRVREHPSLRHVVEFRQNIPIPALPPALEGLRIVHLSDLHVGPLLDVACLQHIIDRANRLQPDLIALTGDFVDLSLHNLEDLTSTLRRLQAPLGVWLVLGNHDYLEDGPRLIRHMRQAGLNLLINQTRLLEWRNQRILIAGIDVAHRRRQLAEHVHRTFRQAADHQNVALRILLSHHPAAFDAARRHNVHLTLAGHTHGGQVVWGNNYGKQGLFGLRKLGIRYHRGLYCHGPHFLFVTSGIGSWFPLRIGCPAEIACLTLLRHAA